MIKNLILILILLILSPFGHAQNLQSKSDSLIQKTAIDSKIPVLYNPFERSIIKSPLLFWGGLSVVGGAVIWNLVVDKKGEKAYSRYQKQVQYQDVQEARAEFLNYRTQQQWAYVLMMFGFTGVVFSF